MVKTSASMSPIKSAFIGALFILPFLVLNTIVANKVEPFMSLIRPDIHTSTFEIILLAVVWLLLPIGAFVSVRPMIPTGANGKRKFYLVNSIVASILLIFFIMLSGLWSEMYRCEVLHIPNCD